jgi:hypothetical protein
MQTFLPYDNPALIAACLDNKRLGKQRVEAIQIARILLDLQQGRGWIHHPAVLMWRGSEPWLIKVYLKSVIKEWKTRGFNNDKCDKHYENLCNVIGHRWALFPMWIDEKLIRSHQSNLIRKNPEHYRPFFPDVPDDLSYYWPV